MEGNDVQAPPYPIPERISVIGEEPIRVRVTPHHKPFGIRQILNALDADEVDVIQVSPFGKLVEIADKISSSGCFGRFIISKQQKVSRKHETWFLFASKPVRFSLCKFAIVTGLYCGKFPKHSKNKDRRNI